MRDGSDMELVWDYVRLNSEAAFAEVGQRHLGLVYSAALRHVGVAAQAEEIAQAVFQGKTRAGSGGGPANQRVGFMSRSAGWFPYI